MQLGERETGLEPATACLEGRLPYGHCSLLMKWLHGRLSHRHMLCERAQHKCSQAFCYMTTCPYVFANTCYALPLADKSVRFLAEADCSYLELLLEQL